MCACSLGLIIANAINHIHFEIMLEYIVISHYIQLVSAELAVESTFLQLN